MIIWCKDCSDIRGVGSARSSLLFYFRHDWLDTDYIDNFVARIDDLSECNIITEGEYFDLRAEALKLWRISCSK